MITPTCNCISEIAGQVAKSASLEKPYAKRFKGRSPCVLVSGYDPEEDELAVPFNAVWDDGQDNPPGIIMGIRASYCPFCGVKRTDSEEDEISLDN